MIRVVLSIVLIVFLLQGCFTIDDSKYEKYYSNVKTKTSAGEEKVESREDKKQIQDSSSKFQDKEDKTVKKVTEVPTATKFVSKKEPGFETRNLEPETKA